MSHLLSSRKFLSVAVVVLAASAGATSAAEAEYKHHPLHRALHELRECRTELKEANHDFGGHREKALHAVDAAIKQIDDLLKAAGEPFKGYPVKDKDVYKKYDHHKHIHHAIHELKEAHKYLKESKDNFGDHKEKALKDVHHAYVQLEEALKFDKK